MKLKVQLQLKEILFIFSCTLCCVYNNIVVTGTKLNAKECEPKSCGNGIDISYPFWLEDHQPSYCGYPLMKLHCESDTNNITNSLPIIKFFSRSFYVKNIFYENQSMIVVTAEVAYNSCPLPPYNYTGDLYPFRTSSANDIIFFLLNCSNPLSGYNNISCAGDGDGKYDYFGGVYENTSKLNADSRLCQLITVPALRYSKENYGNFATIVRDGWMSSWDLPDCSDCKKSGGTCGYNAAEDNFMCICRDKAHKYYCVKNKKRLGIITGVSIASGVLLVLAVLFLSWKKKMQQNSPSSISPVNDQSFKKDGENLNTHLFLYGELIAGPKQYKFSEIKRMTKSFGNKLGEGGFGTVFKGILPDGHLTAVKVLNEAKGNGEDFTNEVASISRTSHVNIVSLLGYCMEKKKRTLVYEYMPNGSLDKYIFADESQTVTILGWNKLYEIAIGIARGLEYLHRGCNTRIVHFDIKPHNILLDKDFKPKISDFGLAKLSSPLKSNISMVAARGTAGYIAPEVFSRNFGVVSTKSDVYSYGMMVLEMVGGRKNIDAAADNSSEVYFPHWIHDHVDFYCQSKISEVTRDIEEKAKKMITVSLWCIQMLPENRPSMSKVVSMLEGSIHELQMPPKP